MKRIIELMRKLEEAIKVEVNEEKFNELGNDEKYLAIGSAIAELIARMNPVAAIGLLETLKFMIMQTAMPNVANLKIIGVIDHALLSRLVKEIEQRGTGESSEGDKRADRSWRRAYR